MNKVFITTFFIFCFFHGKSQTSTWGKADYLSFYSKFLKKIDTVKINERDFQIRLWFSNGANRVNTAYFVSLTKLQDRWDVSYYTFTSFPRRNDSIIVHKQVAVKLNYDSLYNQLIDDGLLTLNSDTINDLMDKKGQHSWMWTDSGPTNYTVHIQTKEKRWTVNFKCPKYFYNEAKIDEFKVPLKVISTLLKLMGIEPC
jgi:hypothetical protein